MGRLLMLLMLSCLSLQVWAQNQTVTGKILDEKGQPVANATVSVRGKAIATVTSATGEFTLSIPADAAALEVSALGYGLKEVDIRKDKNVTVTLLTSDNSLGEVVVVAYGQQQKKALTGSVSVVSADKIERQQVTSVGQALQGLAPGVMVINSTGQPGENPVIRIRGVGSVEAVADPLLVVDGVPYYGNLNSINPNDIESMNVLKDASSAALYGSRAANGVILITTKKGKRGKDASISVYGTYGVSSRATKEYPFVNGQQYMELAWEAIRNKAAAAGIANPEQFATDNLIEGDDGVQYNPYNVAKPIGTDGKLVAGAQQLWNTDWAKEVQNNTIARKNVGVNISGGSDNFRYFLSSDYLDQDGYVIKSKFKRISTRFNGDANLKKWLTVGMNLAVSSSNQNYPDQGGSAFRNAVQFGRIMSSIYPLYMRDANGALILDAKGQPQYDFGFDDGQFTVNTSRPVANGTNAVAIQMLDKNLNDRLQTSMNTYGEIKFTNHLKFKSTFGIDRYTYENSTYQNPNQGDAALVSGRLAKESDRTTSWTWNNMLNYQQTFGDHSIGAMASYEAFDYKYKFLIAQKTGFPLPDLDENVGAGGTFEDANSYLNQERLISYLGRVTYNFRNKYFIEGTVRRDGSTRFAPAERWGTFYSVGGSWSISDEAFMRDITAINQLKLRASYGELGNNNLGSARFFPYLSAYQTGYNDIDYSGYYIPTFADPTITWEKSGSFNVGLDFAILKNRLSGSIDYYYKNTFDLLGNIELAPSTGISGGIKSNIGRIANSGVELNLNSVNLTRKNFTWETNLNFGINKNRIKEQSKPFVIDGSFRREVGISLNSFYIYDWAGVDPQTGDGLWWADEVVNGTATGKRITVNAISNATRYSGFGSSLPKVTGGMTNTFRYKAFDFSFLINFALGGKILDQDYIGLMHGDPATGTQLSADILRRWTTPGQVTDVPRLKIGFRDYASPSTRHLVSGDYARLRNVTLGYTLPGSIAGKQDVVKSLRIYVQADNFVTWTKANIKGLDPEVNLNGTTGQRSTPFKTATIGLSVGF